MKRLKKYNDAELEYIARYIMQHYYEPYTQSKRSIFLCGKGVRRTDSKRKLVARAILSEDGRNKYDILLPEKLFGKLYKGVDSYDLDSMERELAKSVNYIIIIPESEGSILELSNFIQHIQLIQKIACFIFDAPKKADSYLTLGPLKKLKKETGRVYNFNTNDSINDLSLRVKTILEGMPLGEEQTITLNAFLSENFLLPAIYLLEPLPLEIAMKLYSFGGALEDPKMTTDMAVKVMIDERLVSMTHEGVEFSDRGFNYFMNYKAGRKKNFDALNRLRIQILNTECRNKSLIMG